MAYSISMSLTLLVCLFCLTITVNTDASRIKRQGLGQRNSNTAIPETNVIYWEVLPPTDGIRYQDCLKPVEDTRTFMNCQTEGAGSEMAKAVCDCASGTNKLYITCYKNGKWYPPILDTCGSSTSEQASVSASTDKSTNNSNILRSTPFVFAIIALILSV